MLHTHIFIVTLFLMIYLFKTMLLFVNQKTFKIFSQKIKIPEMIISVLFLASGLWLLHENSWNFPRWMMEKLSLVVISIPLAIIGTKKENKWLLLIAVICIIGAMAMALNYGRPILSSTVKMEQEKELNDTLLTLNKGADIYAANCVNCHGMDGKKNVMGATDLSTSQLDLNMRFQLIKNGKNTMQPFKERLDDMQIRAVAIYIEKFRK